MVQLLETDPKKRWESEFRVLRRRRLNPLVETQGLSQARRLFARSLFVGVPRPCFKPFTWTATLEMRSKFFW